MSHFVKIFHSADLGASWTEIRHGNEYILQGSPAGITILATGKTLLALGYAQSRSTDSGQTWTQLEGDINFWKRSRLPAVMVNEKTCYKANEYSIHRTTDGGESWHQFMNGMMGTLIIDLVAFNNRLYAHTGYEVYQSTDAGGSWKRVTTDGQKDGFNNPTTRLTIESNLVVVGNILYSLSSVGDNFRIFRLSADGDRLIPVRDVPIFDREKLSYEKFYKSKNPQPLRIISRLQTETAAASRDTFYVEYIGELYKWKLGDPEWTSIGLVDDSTLYYEGFKLAVLEETVYVGKRDGKLFQSFDEGESWRDITFSLPLRFNRFKDIVFAGSSVYVATDSGVMVSQTGKDWRVLTDSAGARPIINRFAVDGSKVYGIGDSGGYRLNTHTQWEQISSEVPNEIGTLAIANNRLYNALGQGYGGPKKQGLFYISLEENKNNK